MIALALMAIPFGMAASLFTWLMMPGFRTTIRIFLSWCAGWILPTIFALAFALENRTGFYSSEVGEVITIYFGAAMALPLIPGVFFAIASTLRRR